MTTRKVVLIPVLDNSASREDELKALRAMKEAAGEHTYLAELFTSELMTYVESAIKADTWPDIALDLACAEESLTELRRELAHKEAEIHLLYGVLGDRDAKIAKLQARMESARCILTE